MAGRISVSHSLRRILGHSTYVMVMRYVHLDKGDLARDVDLRSPF
jgi:hypothetical protein